MPNKKKKSTKNHKKSKKKQTPPYLLLSIIVALLIIIVLFASYKTLDSNMTDITGKAVQLSEQARYSEALDMCDNEKDNNQQQLCYGLVIINQIEADGYIVKEACYFLDYGALSVKDTMSNKMFWNRNIKPLQDECFSAGN